MPGEWVVVLEAGAGGPNYMLDELGLRRLLEALPDVRSVALHSRERYAVQVHIAALEEAEALALAIGHWRTALGTLGIRDARLARAEVLTLEEFERDCDLAYATDNTVAGAVPEVTAADADLLGDRLLWQVFYDPLTRLPALGLFMNHLEQAVMRTRRLGGDHGVVVLKLRSFAAINERWGRSMGDEVLVTCGQRLRAALPAELTVARISGDEFALLVEGATPGPTRLATVALAAVAVPVSIGDIEVPVSASAGIALGRAGQEAEELLAEARAAVGAARDAPAGIEVFRPGLPPAEPPGPLLGVPHDPLGYLLLLQRAAMAANESSSLPQAAGLVVSQVCAHVQWSVGHLYEVAPDGSLQPGGIVQPGVHRFQGLIDFLDRLSVGPGHGLAGEVASTGQPAWVDDIAAETPFPWSEVAAGCGMRAAMAFPVLVGREVVAVLEFFTEQPGPPDATLVEVLRCVGGQLGRVVERRRSQEQLRASEDRLREAQALAQLGSWHTDRQGGRTWSPEMCAILGVPPDGPHTDERLFELVHPDDRERVREGLRSGGETGTSRPLEFRIVRPDGELRWVTTHSRWTWDGAGAILNASGTMLDITDIKIAEGALREGQRELNMAEQVAQLGSWQRDVTTNEIDWSDGMFRLWGVDRSSFHPTMDGLLSYVHPEDRDRMRETVTRAAETDGFATDFRAIIPSGRQRWFRARATVQHDRDGRPARLVGTIQDVTKEKVAEHELRASEQRYRSIVEKTYDGVWVIDADGTTTLVNERMAAMLGRSADELLGKPLVDFLDPRSRAAFLARLPRRRRGLSEQFETTVTRRDGTQLAVLVAASAMTDDAGRYIGSVALLNDVTEWRRQ